MKIAKTFAVAVSIAAVTVLGITETSQAEPDGSQRLRGLGDRVFLVNVEVTSDPFSLWPFGLDVGNNFINCYIFDANGDWSETGFPAVGTWAQHSTGAKTAYTVEAGDVLQEGGVTPAGGKGVLQLVAETFLLPGFFGPGTGLVEFLSVGYEIDESEMHLCPPLYPPIEETTV
jgi:hypothetical protein